MLRGQTAGKEKGLGAMSDLKKKIEDMLSAIAFAEGGEFETAREVVAVKTRVLLVIRFGLAGSKTLKYAVNTRGSMRISTSLS
jgi:hypothetical protein